MKVYLSTIAKNEFQYIKEFVQHHLNFGFDQVIIYDNNQDGEHYDKTLAQEIAENKVQIIDVLGRKDYQNLSYKDAYANHKEEGWIFFLDVDDFLHRRIEKQLGAQATGCVHSKDTYFKQFTTENEITLEKQAIWDAYFERFERERPGIFDQENLVEMKRPSDE